MTTLQIQLSGTVAEWITSEQLEPNEQRERERRQIRERGYKAFAMFAAAHPHEAAAADWWGFCRMIRRRQRAYGQKEWSNEKIGQAMAADERMAKKQG